MESMLNNDLHRVLVYSEEASKTKVLRPKNTSKRCLLALRRRMSFLPSTIEEIHPLEDSVRAKE